MVELFELVIGGHGALRSSPLFFYWGLRSLRIDLGGKEQIRFPSLISDILDDRLILRMVRYVVFFVVYLVLYGLELLVDLIFRFIAEVAVLDFDHHAV